MNLNDIKTIRNSIIGILIAGAISGLVAFLVNKDSSTTSTNIENSNNISVDNSQKNYNNSTLIGNQNIETQIINHRDKETEENNKFLKEDVSNFINSYDGLIDDFLKEEDLTNALKVTKRAIEPIKDGKFKEGIKILSDEKIEKEVKILNKLLYEFEILTKKENQNKEKLVGKFKKINNLRKKIYQFYTTKAIAYRGLGDKLKAKFYEDKAKEINQQALNTLEKIYNFYWRNGEREKALEVIDKIIEFYPDNSDAYIAKGIFYSFSKQYYEALKNYDKAIALNPNKSAYHGRGGVFAGLKLYDKAIEDYNKVIELNGDVHLNDSAYYNMAVVYYNKKDLNQSQYYMQKAVELNPSYKNDNLYKILFESKK